MMLLMKLVLPTLYLLRFYASNIPLLSKFLSAFLDLTLFKLPFLDHSTSKYAFPFPSRSGLMSLAVFPSKFRYLNTLMFLFNNLYLCTSMYLSLYNNPSKSPFLSLNLALFLSPFLNLALALFPSNVSVKFPFLSNVPLLEASQEVSPYMAV